MKEVMLTKYLLQPVQNKQKKNNPQSSLLTADDVNFRHCNSLTWA